MKKMLYSLFASPDRLLQVMSHGEIQDAIEDGDRILVDADGNTSVNIRCQRVQEDFKRHVDALKRA
ncbi:hypothetical protein GA0061071_104314 [Kosakonia oryzendophytica]|uniref:Uncharacterized protein n=1 Tax=Kosakonia oryzendophytica TaxID=1005665 RepID=A0A1C4BBX4_9ENTR|nr:hypothetical protein [Kosakonia oryzendophytica]AMO48493.1 Hypothetical protein AKI40_2088 [Enterobacter sp. FY-07]TDT60463.1 hypothetical protein DFO53_2090 [Enterobacter sp. AG5470]WBT56976.1 hypothetical protein O9K67_17680 [Kosakonia oryzendophytica]SCC04365.1 hypothetical protein GA0061071_104314 [Kosakonia oryzendophytica]